MSEIYIGENGNWYINGEDTGKSSRGQDGLSAYQIAVSYGYKGNMFEWLNDLKGDSAYKLAVKTGYKGTEEEWIKSLNGADGLTPHVGEAGSWMIGNEDTGIPADAEKALEKKIVANTDIKEDGMVMDGKMVSEALAELNGKYKYQNCTITGTAKTTWTRHLGDMITIPDGYSIDEVYATGNKTYTYSSNFIIIPLISGGQMMVYVLHAGGSTTTFRVNLRTRFVRNE